MKLVTRFLAIALLLASMPLFVLAEIDNDYKVDLPIPAEYKMRNVGGRDGLGLCVFTSINWAARWQNEPSLWDFQVQMRKELGGGWPEKVDAMLAKYAKGVQYIQDTTGDFELLKAAVDSGRMPGVTYAGHDDHYGQETIAHMVNVVSIDDTKVVICDNNYPNDYVVWSHADFKRRWMGKDYLIRSGNSWTPVGGSWSVILLHPAPPPSPRK